MTEQQRFDLTHLGLGSLSLVCGELAVESADVLVNEANNHLQMTGAVAGALRARGGVEIHQEAISMAPVSLGRVVRTGAGRLAAGCVYHAVTKDYDLDRGLSGKVVAAVVEECLSMAEEDGAESLCLPLFGADGGSALLGLRMPIEAMVEGLEAAGREQSQGPEVRIVVRDPDEFAEARLILKDLRAGSARRDEESQLAEDYLAQLMAELGGDDSLEQ
jgi:O-acetyl-ADP-ribose deacetylase (regulator of RNase III)